jgi:hypothetical protein
MSEGPQHMDHTDHDGTYWAINFITKLIRVQNTYPLHTSLLWVLRAISTRESLVWGGGGGLAHVVVFSSVLRSLLLVVGLVCLVGTRWLMIVHSDVGCIPHEIRHMASGSRHTVLPLLLRLTDWWYSSATSVPPPAATRWFMIVHAW